MHNLGQNRRKKLMRPPSCKIKDEDWGYNGAFWLSHGFFAPDLWANGDLISQCPRIFKSRVGNGLEGTQTIQTISVVYALACLANFSKWLRERELLHSCFLLSLWLSWRPRAETIAAGRVSMLQRTNLKFSEIQNVFYSSVKPSKHVKKRYLIG